MIDDKLREISLEPPEECEVMHSLSKQDIAQIKQAFADGGYILPEGQTKYGFEIGDKVYLTGQEWFERFDRELKTLVSRGDGETWMGWDCGEVREAAKRASGIDVQSANNLRRE